jgi:rRNA maturation RNase YbeY
MVLIRNSQRQHRFDAKTLAFIIEDLLKDLSLSHRDLSILFVSNRTIAMMNKEYFLKTRPTNVISFGYGNGMAGEVLGDIIISVQKAAEEADTAGVHFYERLLTLIVHGIVHILGFDHEAGEGEARRMAYREKKFMAIVRAHPAYEKLTKSEG